MYSTPSSIPTRKSAHGSVPQTSRNPDFFRTKLNALKHFALNLDITVYCFNCASSAGDRVPSTYVNDKLVVLPSLGHLGNYRKHKKPQGLLHTHPRTLRLIIRPPFLASLSNPRKRQTMPYFIRLTHMINYYTVH
jgi:hypothetical protein